MKLNLKASVYASMVEVEGNLVHILPSGRLSVIAPVGACCSLLETSTNYPTSNTRYRYNVTTTCLGKILGVTEYFPVTVDAGEYTYSVASAVVTHLHHNKQ